MDEPSAFLLDIDGVLVTAWEPIPGAVGAVTALRRAGHGLRFLTNTTSRTAAEIASALGDAGIDVHDGELLTAAVATGEHLRLHHPGARCLVLNDGPIDDLGPLDLAAPDDERADVVVVGSGGDAITWHSLNVALRCLLDGAALVAMHGSPLWRTAEGMCLDGAAFVTMLEAVTSSRATVVGKPAPAMFAAALASLGVDASHATMVGDDVRSDVLAAQSLGIRGVLVRTGKFREEALEGLEGRPDLIVDSIADLERPDVRVR
jgi:HAD superfamily hydrolase (TIGR01458 family)